jgi:hypothetical protein
LSCAGELRAAVLRKKCCKSLQIIAESYEAYHQNGLLFCFHLASTVLEGRFGGITPVHCTCATIESSKSHASGKQPCGQRCSLLLLPQFGTHCFRLGQKKRKIGGVSRCLKPLSPLRAVGMVIALVIRQTQRRLPNDT